MNELALIVVTLLASAAICNLLYNLATARVAIALGVPVSAIVVGQGPILLQTSLGRAPGGATLRIALFPTGGSVQFAPADAAHDPEHPSPFEQADWALKFLIALAGPLWLILVAAIVLRGEAFAQTASFWPELFGVLTRVPQPLDLHGLLWPVIQERGYPTAFALFATKFAAFNLTPIPPLSGGMALRYALEAMGVRVDARVLDIATRIGIALMIVVLAAVLFRAGFWLWVVMTSVF